MDCDVVVVGGGPSGSTAAREIASRGHRVILLERERFPRDKACGGGISLGCADRLPFDISAVVEQRVCGVILGDPRTGSRTIDWAEPFMYLTRRADFDALLVTHARDAGVTVREDAQATAVTSLPSGGYQVTVRGGDGAETRYTARVVVGADGANGVVRRAVGLPPTQTGVALEANLPCPDGVPDWLASRIAISPGLVAGGYGWLFPKGDHINIGVGGWEFAGPSLREALHAYVRAYGWDPAELVETTGHLLPFLDAHPRAQSGGIALAGDAAGFVDPLTGGGIENAVASALALAPVVDRYLHGESADLTTYERALHRGLYPRLRRARLLAEIAYGLPHPLMRRLTSSQRVVEALVNAIESGPPDESSGGTALHALIDVIGPCTRAVNRVRFGPH